MKVMDIVLPTGVCRVVDLNKTGRYKPISPISISRIEKFTGNDASDVKITLSNEYTGWSVVKPYYGNKGGLFQVLNTEA